MRKNSKAILSSKENSKTARIWALEWWNSEFRHRLPLSDLEKSHSATESGLNVGVLTHSLSLSIRPESPSDTLGTETVKVHYHQCDFSEMDDFKWIPTLLTRALLLNKYISTYMHLFIKNAFLRFMCLYLPETLSEVYCCKSKYELSPVFFSLSTLTLWEVALTVTYIHSSSYVLFMAFQQLCNPRGWKYFPFATVTRAVEKKYEQLPTSLMVGSDNTLQDFGLSFFLKGKSRLSASCVTTLGLSSSGSGARAHWYRLSLF